MHYKPGNRQIRSHITTKGNSSPGTITKTGNETDISNTNVCSIAMLPFASGKQSITDRTKPNETGKPCRNPRPQAPNEPRAEKVTGKPRFRAFTQRINANFGDQIFLPDPRGLQNSLQYFFNGKFFKNILIFISLYSCGKTLIAFTLTTLPYRR